MKEQDVIDAQIERAHKLFEGFGPAFDRPKEISNGILVLGNICDVLIRIVENQKARIDELEKSSLRVLKGSDFCECGHTLSLHGERQCSWIDCRCRRFKLKGVL